MLCLSKRENKLTYSPLVVLMPNIFSEFYFIYSLTIAEIVINSGRSFIVTFIRLIFLESHFDMFLKRMINVWLTLILTNLCSIFLNECIYKNIV